MSTYLFGAPKSQDFIFFAVLLALGLSACGGGGGSSFGGSSEIAS